MPVLGPARTAVDQIPGETLNRAWRADKPGPASAARKPMREISSAEARTATRAEGHQGSPAPPADPFVHK